MTPHLNPIPWRRVTGLLRPRWTSVAGMLSLSVAGVLFGLVPPLALGTLVNALVEHGGAVEGALLAAAIGVAVLVEAGAYIVSDGLYARAAGGLQLDLRTAMLRGLRSLRRRDEPVQGMSARFVSDAATIERITLAILDSSVMLAVELLSALVAIALLAPASLALMLPLLGLTWLITRRTQAPVAAAGLRRQEALEGLTAALEDELHRSDRRGSDPQGLDRSLGASLEHLRNAEVRLGWLRGANLQGSGGLAKLGPLAVVATAALTQTPHAGTLVSLYLLAQRAFSGFDGIVDLNLDLSGARGAVNRCFALIDAGGRGDPVIGTVGGETYADRATSAGAATSAGGAKVVFQEL